MAYIKPFRGLRYSPQKFCDLSDVITMPYDRIHEPEQARYYAQSPYNYARIIQGKATPDDNEQNNVYTRAAAYAQNWLAENILIRDPEPALYVLEQRFTTGDGQERVRRGLMAALQLSRFDEGEVLPHEFTLAGPKVDRLHLTRATQTSWGHIFMLYPDDTSAVNKLLQPFMDSHMPAIVQEKVIEPEVEQNFWVVNDRSVIDAVTAEMENKKPIIVADGHHRYETALTYRDEMRKRYPDAPAHAAFNYVMATFVSMSDSGLVVLPTHRLIYGYKPMTSPMLLRALETYFTIEQAPNPGMLQELMAEASADHPRIGFYDGNCTLLTLRSMDVMASLLPDRDAHFRGLDVAILHELIIEKTMGLSKESVQRKENITYLRDVEPGYTAVDTGEANFMFLLNPTRIEQIRNCTNIGERMPQKSTDFYPKIPSGLVALPLSGSIS